MFDLFLSDVQGCIESSSGEDFDGANPAEVAPVITIWRNDYGGVVVAYVLAHEQTRAVG